MLPEAYRLRHRADFAKTVRSGRRIARPDLVVHVVSEAMSRTPREADRRSVGRRRPVHRRPRPVVRIGGPRFGLIISKEVGTAVVRHRVARQLRHLCADLVCRLPVDTDVVIRALPGAAGSCSAELDRQLRGALGQLLTSGRLTTSGAS